MDPWRFALLVTVGRSGRGHLDPKLYEPVEIFFKGLEVPPQRFDVLGDFLRRLLDLLLPLMCTYLPSPARQIALPQNNRQRETAAQGGPDRPTPRPLPSPARLSGARRWAGLLFCPLN
jgi:hypothetical protein